jgi:DNA-binding MarR family transcriptional regulator
LSEFELVRRKVDERDRRSVLIERTPPGTNFLRDYGEIIVSSGRDVSGSSRFDVEAA